MRPDIKANTFSDLFFIRFRLKIAKIFGLTIGCSLVMEFPVEIWKLNPWQADVLA